MSLFDQFELLEIKSEHKPDTLKFKILEETS